MNLCASSARGLVRSLLFTANTAGRIRAYVGEGELTNDALDTFGNRAVARIPRLQSFMQHVVMTQTRSAAIRAEAFGHYLGWETHHHNAPTA